MQTAITPSRLSATERVLDRTPPPVAHFAITARGALLAKIRHNNRVGCFLSLDVYSIQCGVRERVRGVGQIEIDEVYVGVDRAGRQFVVPVQAKGGNDKLSAVQARQDIVCCTEKFPGLICRAISAQFMEGDLIALLELTLEDGAVKVVAETHYRLVPADQVSREELLAYGKRKT